MLWNNNLVNYIKIYILCVCLYAVIVLLMNLIYFRAKSIYWDWIYRQSWFLWSTCYNTRSFQVSSFTAWDFISVKKVIPKTSRYCMIIERFIHNSGGRGLSRPCLLFRVFTAISRPCLPLYEVYVSTLGVHTSKCLKTELSILCLCMVDPFWVLPVHGSMALPKFNRK